jgi:hypothetical protein
MRHIIDSNHLTVSRPLYSSLMVVSLILAAPVVSLLAWPQAAAQASPAAAASRSAWSVALPATATLRLKQGGSLSGQLVALTPTTLTLAVGQKRQTVALARVSTIDFQQSNDLWVTLPNGIRQQVRPIRGLSLPLDALPSSALQVHAASATAIVDLTPLLTAEQFAKLTHNPGVMYVLKRLEVAADGSLGLLVRPYGVQ